MTTQESARDAAPAGPDERTAGDLMRARCPVAHDGEATWTLVGHDVVRAAAEDPETFSSTVTHRRVVPNGMDGAEHAAFRGVVDRYLTDERVRGLEPVCRAVAEQVVAALPAAGTVDVVADVGVPFAVRAQCAWLGWPAGLEDELVAWIGANRAATRSRDRVRTAAVAEDFDAIVGRLVAERRGTSVVDVTSELMADTVDGRPLTEAELVSILRNWTAGDLASLAACAGVVVHLLASRPEVQRHLRGLVAAGDDGAVEDAVEELLRIDDPFVTNRRVTTRDVDVAGVPVPGGATVLLHWTAANRDPAVFGEPDRFDPAGNASRNLVFGAGPHFCPGRALTLMELRVVVTALLAATGWIDHATDVRAVREAPPGGGWESVPVVLRDARWPGETEP